MCSLLSNSASTSSQEPLQSVSDANPLTCECLFSAVYCSCYATMLSLLGIQFYYRFVSVTSPLRLTIFGKENFHKWGLIVIVYSLVWAAICYFLCGPNDLKLQELEEEILKTYCLAPGEYAYVGSQYFYRNQTTDSITWHIPSVIGMSTFFLLMLFTFLMVMYFGVRTYLTLVESGLTCFASKDLQKQFFQTLVCQTLIPFFLMYLPVTCLFLFPITGLKLNGMENWIPVLVAIYPCLEPLVALYCIKDFRNKIYSESRVIGFQHVKNFRIPNLQQSEQ